MGKHILKKLTKIKLGGLLARAVALARRLRNPPVPFTPPALEVSSGPDHPQRHATDSVPAHQVPASPMTTAPTAPGANPIDPANENPVASSEVDSSPLVSVAPSPLTSTSAAEATTAAIAPTGQESVDPAEPETVADPVQSLATPPQPAEPQSLLTDDQPVNREVAESALLHSLPGEPADAVTANPGNSAEILSQLQQLQAAQREQLTQLSQHLQTTRQNQQEVLRLFRALSLEQAAFTRQLRNLQQRQTAGLNSGTP